MAKEVGGDLETKLSDWTEGSPEELGTDRPGVELEETETSRKVLTPKALDLMERISEYGYLTMHEVHFIFGNKTWAYKVVKGLRELGLVADFETLMSPRTGHHLTAKGYRVLGKFGRLKVGSRFAPERYNLFIFRHRMACAKVGLLLEKHPLVHQFLPESRLWKRRTKDTDKLCDGEFCYRLPGEERGERVGLEVELNLKNHDKRDESFRQFHRRRDLDQVWWICADENIRRALRREVLNWPSLEPQRHFLALLHEFLAAKDKAELMEPRGDLLTIDPAQPTLRPRPPVPPEPPPPASPPASVPKPVVEARAEVPRPPEPAPVVEAEPGLAWMLLSWFGSLALRLLKWGWEWLCDSWTVYRYNRWGFELKFHRWPHVCAAGALVVGLAVYRHWPAILKRLDPPPPPPTWRKRKLRDYAVQGPNWTLYPAALSSAAGRYRFKAELVSDQWQRTVCGAAIFDVRDRRLASSSWKDVTIKQGYRIDPDLSFEFQGSRSMDRFFVVVSEGLFSCDKTGRGERFLVRFE